MSSTCTCPPSAAIQSITLLECIEQFGQLARIAGQRIKKADGTINKFAGIVTPDLLASWTPKMTAIDGEKIQITPVIQEPNNEAGAERTYGGGNLTLGGIPISLGSEPSKFTAKFLQRPQREVAPLKNWKCETMGAYLIDKDGVICCLADDPAAPTEWYPIPFFSWYVGDKVFGGYEGVDYNALSFAFPENWSDNLVLVRPSDFNAFTDLQNS